MKEHMAILFFLLTGSIQFIFYFRLIFFLQLRFQIFCYLYGSKEEGLGTVNFDASLID